jgi:SH3-like domain-containing protein
VGLKEEPTTSGKGILNLEPNTLLKVEAATAAWYKVSLPGGEKGFVPGSAVTVAHSAVKKVILKNGQPLLDEPSDQAARKSILIAGQPVNILAGYKDFYFVSNDKENGWISKKTLL